MNIINSLININDKKTLEISLCLGDDISKEMISFVTKVYGITFFENKLVLIYNSKRDIWGFPGGTIEQGESLKEALLREILEETELRLVSSEYLGYSYINANKNELQVFFYVEAEKIKDGFVDPDESVTKNEYIDPTETSQYIDWGQVGESLISKALEKNKSK